MATTTPASPFSPLHIDNLSLSFPTYVNGTAWQVVTLGSGVLAYEITVNFINDVFVKHLGNALSKYQTYVGLATATVVMLWSSIHPQVSTYIIIGECLIYAIQMIYHVKVSKNQDNLPSYMTDMVQNAKNGQYSALIGYETIVDDVEITLNKPTKPNAAIKAHPGVGKSAIPETIAYKISQDQYPAGSVFKNAKLIQVSMVALMAGTMWRGTLEERVQEIIRRAQKDPSLIYFIDELHLVINVGKTVGNDFDIASALLPALARGELRILGATTPDDYKRIETNAAFARRFTSIVVDPPDPKKCFLMLAHKYIALNQNPIKISPAAIQAAIFFTDRDVLNRYFPDKAIDVIDYAISKADLASRRNLQPVASIELTVQEIAQAHYSLLEIKRSPVEALINQFQALINFNPAYFSEAN